MPRRKRNSRKQKFSILEIVIASLTTLILAAAAFRFYSKMNQQPEPQYNISKESQLCCSSLHDIRKSLFQAGFKLPGHAPYRISGDTLAVYYYGTHAVDSVQYYLTEYSKDEYDTMVDLPAGQHIYKLVKKVNSSEATVFADCVAGIDYEKVDSAIVVVTVKVPTFYSGKTSGQMGGHGEYSVSERMRIRNVG